LLALILAWGAIPASKLAPPCGKSGSPPGRAALHRIPTGSFPKDHQKAHKQRKQRLPEGPKNLGWYNEA